jgi:hypothetical protein
MMPFLFALLVAQAGPSGDRIRALAGVDKPDVGYSPTMAGGAFLPVPSARRFGAGRILVDHGLAEHPDLAALVAAGPDALPLLLESLTDATPSKLKISGGFDAMWYGHEIAGNPFNAAEMVALRDVKPDAGFGGRGEAVASHVVSVGDLCFVAVGQITNRPYQAVRYQPTACVVVNSPVKDPKLAEEVRAIWGKGDLRAKLRASLRIDFESRGAGSEEFRSGAALRLLYYFPKESVPAVAERLRNVEAEESRGADFLRAVGGSPDPAIRAELLAAAKRVADPKLFLAALEGLPAEHDDALLGRLKVLLAALPPSERLPNGDGFGLLGAVLRRFPGEAGSILRDYLKGGSAQRIRSACQAFARAEGELGELAIEILAPLLKDARPIDGRTYAPDPGRGGPRLPIRLCDEAAQALALRNPELLQFKLAGSHELLDRQIEDMLKAIAGRPR